MTNNPIIETVFLNSDNLTRRDAVNLNINTSDIIKLNIELREYSSMNGFAHVDNPEITGGVVDFRINLPQGNYLGQEIGLQLIHKLYNPSNPNQYPIGVSDVFVIVKASNAYFETAYAQYVDFNDGNGPVQRPNHSSELTMRFDGATVFLKWTGRSWYLTAATYFESNQTTKNAIMVAGLETDD